MLADKFTGKEIPHRGHHTICAAFAALAVVVAGGCGKAEKETVPVFPVTGQITFKGQPAAGAIIGLHPKAQLEDVPTPRASVDKNGNFAVSTYQGGDGAPAGEYVLTVQWYKQIKSGADVVAGPNVIPAKYSRAETSSLKIDVAAGDNAAPPIRL